MNKKIIYDLINNKITNIHCNFQLLFNYYNNNKYDKFLNALKINKSIKTINFEFIQNQYINEDYKYNNEIIDDLLNPILDILKNKQITRITICTNIIYLFDKIETLLINDINIKLYIIFFKDKFINENEINNFKNKYSSRIINYSLWTQN